MSNKYTLYLDEILPADGFQYFCLAGVIIEDKYYNDIVIQKIKEIKKATFGVGNEEVLLHEADVRKPKKIKEGQAHRQIYIKRLSNSKKQQKYFDRITHFFEQTDLYVISASLHHENSKTAYPQHRDRYFMCLQILLENFTHFLIENNGKGSIKIESRKNQESTILDDQLNKHFSNLRFHTGTLFYDPPTIQKYVSSISFPQKSDNIIGLQIADMIPNALNRKLSGMDLKMATGLWEEINKRMYDGNRSNVKRFGMKIMVKDVQKNVY